MNVVYNVQYSIEVMPSFIDRFQIKESNKRTIP